MSAQSKHPENVSSPMLIQGVLFENACASIFAMRDGEYYKFWVYIFTSRTGTLCVGVIGYLSSRI